MPPVGLNLIISCIRFEKPVTKLYRACFPFIIIMIIALMVITYCPWMSLALIKRFGIR
jgi:TRAP-type C4-dicarboxylate transport system permease large subunit